MNRWLIRVYLTLMALCVVLFIFGCGKQSVPPLGQPSGDRGQSRDASIWHQRIEVVSPGGYGVPQQGYCMSDGEPAISYVDVANTDLYYTHSFDADGTSDGTSYAWDTPVLVDNAATTLGASSMMADTSYDYIAYQRDGDLYYVYSSDLYGTSWSSPVVVDSGTGSNTGQFPIIMDVNGTRAIAYVDGDSHSLKYVRYQAGFGWLSPQTVISSGVSSSPISLAIINGQPAIAYLDSSNSDVCYIRATNSSGSSWPTVNPPTTPVVVESSPDGPTGVSMVETSPGSGYPLIFFKGTQTFGPSTFYEVQCRLGNQNGTSFGSVTLVAVSPNDEYGDELTSCLQDNGYPAVAFQGGLSTGSGELRLCRASAANGSTWNSQQVLDDNSNSGHEPSMLVVNGKLGITYNEQSSGNIEFVSATETTGGAGFAVPVCQSALVNWSLPDVDATMAWVNGRPAFAYNYRGSLVFKRALDAAGATWPAGQVTIGSSTTVLALSELQLVPSLTHTVPPVAIIVPVIAYIDASDNDLYFCSAQDALGSLWNIPQKVLAGTFDGDLSLAIVNGNPAIAFQDSGNDDLYYIRANNALGSSWPASATLMDNCTGFSLDNYGISLTEVGSSQPGICYTKTATLAPFIPYFYYVTSGLPPTPVQLRQEAGAGPSLRMINGKPAVSSTDLVNGDLMYQYASDSVGSSWNTAFDLDQNDACGGTSLTVVGGYPAIAYTAVNSLEELRYIVATDADGDQSTDWPVNSPELIDSFGDHVGGFPNLLAGGLGKIFGYSYIDNQSTDCIRFCNAP